jgi:hypothetical protein
MSKCEGQPFCFEKVARARTKCLKSDKMRKFMSEISAYLAAGRLLVPVSTLIIFSFFI